MERLLALYHSATPVELEHGRLWYRTARREIKRRARSLSFPWKRFAAIVAALSPGLPWKQNIREARAFIESGGSYRGSFYPRNGEKARALLQGRFTSLRGPKVRAFYSAIIGDEEAITIDGHCINAWLGKRRRLRDTRTDQRRAGECERAFRDAARTVKETPAAFQAIVWGRWRNGAQRPLF